ncbi:MAG: hypothetical protein ACPLXC_01930 [Candidatus Pacearchaeota archaeon]
MVSKPQIIDLRAKILKDTCKYQYVDVKRKSTRLFSGADPDMKLLVIDFSISYDGRNWINCQDHISLEGESLTSKKSFDEIAQKYFKAVADSTEKDGINHVKYSEDAYVFHR